MEIVRNCEINPYLGLPPINKLLSEHVKTASPKLLKNRKKTKLLVTKEIFDLFIFQNKLQHVKGKIYHEGMELKTL